MNLPVWGQLQKSLDNPETIEEAIIRLINEHAADPTAHLAEGESLNMHKTDEVIDHPAFSVVNDKVPDGGLSYRWFPLDRTVIFSNMGEAGWAITTSTGSSGFQYVGNLSIQSGNVSGRYAIADSGAGWRDYVRWDSYWIWQVSAVIFSHANQTLTFGPCQSNYIDGSRDGVFLRFHNGAVQWGISHDYGTEITRTLDIADFPEDETLLIRMFWNSDNETLTLSVNGVTIDEWVEPAFYGEIPGPGSFEIISNNNAYHSAMFLDLGMDFARQTSW